MKKPSERIFSLIFLICLITGGCTFYQEEVVQSEQLLRRNNYPVMILHFTDSSKVQVDPLKIAMTRIDSLQYIIYLEDGQKITVPVEDLQKVTLQTVNKKKTYLVYGSIYLGITLLIVAAITFVIYSIILIMLSAW